jgi:hypothetical protein
MKLLIEIGKVPVGSKITKRTGEKIYEVRDKVSIYSEKETSKLTNELVASTGTKLIVSIDPQYSFAIASVPDTLEVLWEVSKDELRNYLDDMESDR